MSGQEKLRDLRIVLVGKTGVGKSAAGNTILKGNEFKSKLSSSSVTSQCRKLTEDVDGRQVAVIDTPGLFDTTMSKDDVLQEITECISFSSPGPHAFLVVIQLGRFTQEEQDTVEIIQTTFGSESSKYTIVLFTHGDGLEGTIEEFLGESKELAQFTKQCSGGYHVFNNKDRENDAQVSELLEKIDKMVTINGGGCYTNEMYKMAEEEIEKEKNLILEENENLDESKARELAMKAMKNNGFSKIKMFIVTVSTGAGAVAGSLAGSPLGPGGMAVGAGTGATVGAGVGIKLSEKCHVQ